MHAFVRLRFLYAADRDVRRIGVMLDTLVTQRNAADYYLGALPLFGSDADASRAISEVASALPLLDAVQADAARRAAVIADMAARWP